MVLWEDIRTTETTLYIVAKNRLYGRFFGPRLVGYSQKVSALKTYVVDCKNKSEHAIRSKCCFRSTILKFLALHMKRKTDVTHPMIFVELSCVCTPTF